MIRIRICLLMIIAPLFSATALVRSAEPFRVGFPSLATGFAPSDWRQLLQTMRDFG